MLHRSSDAAHDFGRDGELVSRAEEQLARVIDAFEKSTLPDQPDRDRVNRSDLECRATSF